MLGFKILNNIKIRQFQLVLPDMNVQVSVSLTNKKNSYVKAPLCCAYLSRDSRDDFDSVAPSIFETNSLRLLIASFSVRVVSQPENKQMSLFTNNTLKPVIPKLVSGKFYENPVVILIIEDLFTYFF